MTPETRLPFVLGGPSAKRLADAFDIRTVGDLLGHYPRRYVERGTASDLDALVVDEQVTVQARVRSAQNRTYGSRGSSRRGRQPVRTEVVVTDGSGELLLTFFKQPWQVDKLKPGSLGLFAGKVGSFRGRRQLLHPEYVLLDATGADGGEYAAQLVRPIISVYPATARLASWRIAACCAAALDALGDVDDPVPDQLLARRDLVGLRAALEGVHRPEENVDHRRGRDRLRYDEALVTQVVLARRRHRLDGLRAVAREPVAGGLLDRFEQRLPFSLTAGQRRVGAEIAGDLVREHPMHRLLQGEVGSGKTVVALRAMLQVVDAGAQAALLAPTEVLAAQHHRTLTGLLGDLALGGMLGGADGATGVRLLTGSMSTSARRQALLDLASGVAGIAVGTHALLEERVGFAELGLVVVDEQHRFGVEQRAALAERGSDARPHVLVMTATPIPRTVAMTVFGDLDTSVLAEVPTGRLPVQTTVVPAERPGWLERGWQRVREEVASGRQAYVVCPRIGVDDEPEGMPEEPVEADPPARSPGHGVLATAAELTAGPLAGLRVEVLHGRLAPDVKDDVMDRFAAGSVDVVVATTVVEVGVDVPNATVMVVFDADRFGLSQLHQLRGRVGRGAEAGLCLLLTDAPDGTPARRRLDDVAATTDGFEVSRLDVALRREGDVLGAVQSGRRSSLRLLSVVEHEEVITQARADATELVSGDPDLVRQPALAAAVAALEDTTRADFIDKT
ncbi:MAG: ATP-dependent DNA helicase RecG [Nocardioidaceae bacterium]|nr:ATP-dependent DNA helicase RecG [Nocardioidaceae bacterium]